MDKESFDDMLEDVRQAEITILSFATLMESMSKGMGGTFIDEVRGRLTKHYHEHVEEAIAFEKRGRKNKAEGKPAHLSVLEGGKEDEEH